MSKGFHISPKTGRAGVCDPKVTGICQFAEDGVEPPHYSTKDDAETVISQKLKEEFGDTNPITKKPFSKSYLEKRKRDRRDSDSVRHLSEITEKRIQKEKELKELLKNGKPKSDFSQNIETERKDGIIYFNNGMTSKYVNYTNKTYVENDRKLALALARYANARTISDDPRYIEGRRNEAVEESAFLPLERRKSFLAALDRDNGSLLQHAKISLDISNDYTNGYPLGTTHTLIASEEEDMNYPETNDVKDIKELYSHDMFVEPIISDIKNASSIRNLNANVQEYERFISGAYSKRLEAEVTPEVLKSYRQRKSDEFKTLQINTLKKIKDSVKTPFFSSRKTKEANARKIAEIDAMIQDL